MRYKMSPGQEYLNLLMKQNSDEKANHQSVLQDELKAGVVNLTGGLTQNAVKALAVQAGIACENISLIAPGVQSVVPAIAQVSVDAKNPTPKYFFYCTGNTKAAGHHTLIALMPEKGVKSNSKYHVIFMDDSPHSTTGLKEFATPLYEKLKAKGLAKDAGVLNLSKSKNQHQGANCGFIAAVNAIDLNNRNNNPDAKQTLQGIQTAGNILVDLPLMQQQQYVVNQITDFIKTPAPVAPLAKPAMVADRKDSKESGESICNTKVKFAMGMLPKELVANVKSFEANILKHFLAKASNVDNLLSRPDAINILMNIGMAPMVTAPKVAPTVVHVVKPVAPTAPLMALPPMSSQKNTSSDNIGFLITVVCALQDYSGAIIVAATLYAASNYAVQKYYGISILEKLKQSISDDGKDAGRSV